MMIFKKDHSQLVIHS